MPGPGFFRTFALVYRKDSALEWRSPAGFLAMLLFALILATLYHYAMVDTVFRDPRNLDGVLLATLFFVSTIQTGRNIHNDSEAGALRVSLLAPVDPAGYYLGKVAASWQLLVLFLVLYIPLQQILLTGDLVQLRHWRGGFVGPALAALSLAALGVLLSCIARGNRLREILAPLLQLPAALPVFLLTVDFMQAVRAADGDLFARPLAIIALLAPAGIYCGLGSVLYFALAADE